MRAVRMLIFITAMEFIAGSCFCADDKYFFKPPQFHFALFGGAGLTDPSGNASHGSIHLGSSFEAKDGDIKKLPFPMGLRLEIGYAGPVNDMNAAAAFFSANYAPQWRVSNRKRMTAFPTVGYTRLFGKGNALNYGGGLDFYIKDGMHALRFEVRDYLRFAVYKEHCAALRIAYVFGYDLK
jgi:hypothetical protein